MSMKYVRDTYGVPAKRGMAVEVWMWTRVSGWRVVKRGRITSASHHLHVDGRGPYHPTDGVVYLDKNGAVICDTRETHM